MKNRKWLHGLVFAAGLGALGCGSNAATDAGPADVVGEAPVAVADHFTAQRNTLLQVPAASGLLANDHVPSGTTITAPTPTSATTAGGTLMLGADGGFEYTPPPAFTGQDSFSYTITNARGDTTAPRSPSWSTPHRPRRTTRSPSPQRFTPSLTAPGSWPMTTRVTPPPR